MKLFEELQVSSLELSAHRAMGERARTMPWGLGHLVAMWAAWRCWRLEGHIHRLRKRLDRERERMDLHAEAHRAPRSGAFRQATKAAAAERKGHRNGRI